MKSYPLKCGFIIYWLSKEPLNEQLTFQIKFKDGEISGFTKYLHREDGPAVEHVNGNKEWWIGGNLHREDGPAVEWQDGHKFW